MKEITIVTTALPEREYLLQRLIRQAPWIRNHEWVICGPGPLIDFARQYGARFVASNENMGTCRNLCAEAATGEIIVQIDDDDWQHPGRLEKQVRALTSDMPGTVRKPEVVGSSWLYCLEHKTGIASRISYWDAIYCLPGASLAYWKSAWKRHPFEPVRSEDGGFTAFFGAEGSLFDMHDPKLLVYMREHGEHLPDQFDWWRETRKVERRYRSVEEIVRDRLRNPQVALSHQRIDPPHDVAILHEREAATVYVKWLMGLDFDRFVQAPASEIRPASATHRTPPSSG